MKPAHLAVVLTLIVLAVYAFVNRWQVIGGPSDNLFRIDHWTGKTYILGVDGSANVWIPAKN